MPKPSAERPDGAFRPIVNATEPPRVAVIVPAYNFERFIAEALDSVIAQTYRQWECVVVDDGSTDGTAAVAERYAAADPRIRCLRQPNRGVSSARNLALRSSTAPYVQFLDADDRLVDWKLAEHVRFLDGTPELRSCMATSYS